MTDLPGYVTDKTYDNCLAYAIDSEAADTMNAQGYDCRFIHETMTPAYRERSTGIWSTHVFNGGMPLVTILASDWDDLLYQHMDAMGALREQNVKVFLTLHYERRHAVEEAHGLPCGCADADTIRDMNERHEAQFAASRRFQAERAREKELFG